MWVLFVSLAVANSSEGLLKVLLPLLLAGFGLFAAWKLLWLALKVRARSPWPLSSSLPSATGVSPRIPRDVVLGLIVGTAFLAYMVIPNISRIWDPQPNWVDRLFMLLPVSPVLSVALSGTCYFRAMPPAKGGATVSL